MMNFTASWGKELKGATLFSVVLLTGVSVIISRTAHPSWLAALPLIILIISVFFMVRGYQLLPGVLVIRRLGWRSTVDLRGLISVEVDPQALCGSIRLFGNGGMFSFTGIFRNKKLGVYRVFANNLRNIVVLRLSGRVVVISPDQPEEFVRNIKQYAPQGPVSSSST